MVKLASNTQTTEIWLSHVEKLRADEDISILKSAIELGQGKNPQLLKDGLELADILLSLKMDTESLAAAIIFPFYIKQEIHHDTIAENFGDNILKLLANTMQMRNLDKYQYQGMQHDHHLENIRKMLLSIVSDVRAIILVLAEKLLDLRLAKQLESKEQIAIAQKSLDIFAPLANRLGIWQLKWEMEDLSLRYLVPDTYKQIAKSLETKRLEREAYIENSMHVLSDLLSSNNIKNFKLTGRVKHIYSIYKKMQRKNADISQIYDISAFRVLLDSVDDCYHVLSILQDTWEQIPEEFDDYISQPKANGYQSIHTVLIGPENRIIEVQIRTNQMHQESELGIAAHWQYKEGVRSAPHYEEKIALLRQVMAWENEILNQSEKSNGKQVNDLFADRVYVFTPMGDIIDLPQGATPLDFAYYIHSEVGHRCRGAKVNGKIVPLTYTLQTGQRIEVLTAKHAHPSRDWLNPHLGYIHTVKARSHLHHWFRANDASADKTEAAKTSISIPVKAKAAAKPRKRGEKELVEAAPLAYKNYLTKIAKCCHPKPGDAVIGYITQKNMLSIHKIDCQNINYLKKKGNDRFMDVSAQKH